MHNESGRRALEARLYVCAVGNRAYRWGVLARAWLHIVVAIRRSQPTVAALPARAQLPLVSARLRLRGWKPRLSVVGSRTCTVANCAYRWQVSGICVCPVVLRIGKCSRLGNLVHIEFILKTINQRLAAGGDAVLRNADGTPGLLAIADFNQHAHF